MQGLRLFLQRAAYSLVTMFFLYVGVGRTDENGETTESILNFITGAYPFDGATLTVFILSGLLLYWLASNTTTLQGKAAVVLKSINNTDTRLLITSTVTGLAIALS